MKKLGHQKSNGRVRLSKNVGFLIHGTYITSATIEASEVIFGMELGSKLKLL